MVKTLESRLAKRKPQENGVCVVRHQLHMEFFGQFEFNPGFSPMYRY